MSGCGWNVNCWGRTNISPYKQANFIINIMLRIFRLRVLTYFLRNLNGSKKGGILLAGDINQWTVDKLQTCVQVKCIFCIASSYAFSVCLSLFHCWGEKFAILDKMCGNVLLLLLIKTGFYKFLLIFCIFTIKIQKGTMNEQEHKQFSTFQLWIQAFFSFKYRLRRTANRKVILTVLFLGKT